MSRSPEEEGEAIEGLVILTAVLFHCGAAISWCGGAGGWWSAYAYDRAIGQVR